MFDERLIRIEFRLSRERESVNENISKIIIFSFNFRWTTNLSPSKLKEHQFWNGPLHNSLRKLMNCMVGIDGFAWKESYNR